MDNKERFISLCSTVNREGMAELMKWLDDNDFYTCPASSRFHGAYPGGLLEHSLNVYDELKRLLSVYPCAKRIRVSTWDGRKALLLFCFKDKLYHFAFLLNIKQNKKFLTNLPAILR